MTRAPGPDAVEAALTLLLRRQAARAVGAAGLPADRVVRAGRRAARRRRLLGGTAGGAAVLAAVVGVAAVVDGSVLRRAADAPAAHRAVGGADAPRAADGAFDRPAGDGGGTAGDGEPAPAPLAAGPARVDVARGDAITPADRSPVLLPLPVGARLDAVTRLPAGGWLVRYAGPDGRRWLARASAGGALTRLGQVAAARLSSDGAHLAVRAAGDGPPLRV
ncbi:MAG TPA: hypothetical protein VFY17_03605, partial [Pilimelia sp.]|nr:hypothetical protein [Pilimelia sp.]